jgi:DNA-binding NarL/FixJ family response regulator
MNHQEIRIIIFHANSLYRESIAFVLARQQGISVVRAAAAVAQVEEDLSTLSPDLFVLDFGGLGRTGLNEARRLRSVSAQFKILLIEVPNDEAEILACIECGAAGYVLHDVSIDTLMSNVRAVSAGEALCSPRIAALAFSRVSALAGQAMRRGPGPANLLTKRELEIVALIERGLSNKEIATHLHIEVPTVKNHIHNILDKLRVGGRRQAATYVKEQGLATSLR